LKNRPPRIEYRSSSICFAKGTLVTKEQDGKRVQVPIDNVKEGDKILAQRADG